VALLSLLQLTLRLLLLLLLLLKTEAGCKEALP
jgi:hypothetical protein